MPTRKITLSLTEADIEKMEAAIKDGVVASRSEYVRNLIKADEQRQREVAYIRDVLDQAEASGIAQGTPDEIFERVRRRALARIKHSA